MPIFALILAACLQVDDAALPLVEQDVECVSVAHLSNGGAAVFFWDVVQNDWTYLDHRWLPDDMQVQRAGDRWLLSWNDEADGCYRLVRTKLWVESAEEESPLAWQQERPWFCRLTAVGLKQPQIKAN